jgi:hypothetical protein
MTDDSPEKEARMAEIRATAKRVYDISFDYHLTHAVFGSDEFLVEKRITDKQKEIKKVNDELQAAVKVGDQNKVNTLMGRIELLKGMLRRKFLIMIEYSSLMRDPEGGRVINNGKELIITLPKMILKGLMDETGKLQKEPVMKLRKIMAHELGHIVLHTDIITGAQPLDGYREQLKNQEWEADVFGEELLRLYKEKDHHVE